MIEDIAYWLFKHPTVQMTLTRSISGTDISLDFEWPHQENEHGFEEDMRKGEFDKYKIDIQPYSMKDQTPGERVFALRDIWQRDILPLTQLGLQPDVLAYFAQLAKYGDWPELLNLVPATKYSPNVQDDEMRKPAATSREYVRKNVSVGATPQAQQQQEAMMMLGNQTPETGAA